MLNEPPTAWVERIPIPSWARRAILARERGKCAQCSVDIVLELDEEHHIDHIVPLARGGSNDLVNLQVLCEKCNLLKSASPLPATSSVPQYLRRQLQKVARRRRADVPA